MAELPVQFQTKVEATAQDLRHAYERPLGEGVEGYSDMLVTPGVAADTVDVAAGIGFVRGDGLNDLGLYRCRNDATKNSAAFEAGGIAAPDATKPRLDQIVARVYDDDVDSGGQRKWRLAVLKGTATTGDTLDKREGAAALPNSAMLLADVLVPAGAPAVLKAEAIRDRRPFCYPIVPPLLTDVDMVPLVPLAGDRGRQTVSHGAHDTMQAAVAVVLHRRIVNATKIRWRYRQATGNEEGGEVLTGQYVLTLFDASGRKIVDTGSVAAIGAKESIQTRLESITPATFEAGIYYLFFGLDSSKGSASYMGTDVSVGSNSPGVPSANCALRSSSGGVTVPNTLLGMTDVGGLTASTMVPPIPDICLSVG
jgi:hypothetical protein